jgi:hypothetical protein
MNRITIFLLVSFISKSSFCQKLDTIKIFQGKYSISLKEEEQKKRETVTVHKLGYYQKKKKGRDSIWEPVYFKVSKNEYENYQNEMNKTSLCRPCWQMYYISSGELVSEGLYYTNCPIGETRTYWNNKLKVIAYWRETTLEEREGKHKGKCSLKHGIWKIYSDGIEVRTEKYIDDVLIEEKRF